MVQRDRNLPSIILWSVGNEEWRLEGDEIGARLTKLMQERVHDLDPTRPATVAIASVDTSGNATTTEIVCFNYIAQHDADASHQAHPDVPVVITEEGQTTATRGIYFDDPDAVHLAAYDQPPRPVESSSIEQAWRAISARPWMAGMVVWTGLDYRRETTPFSWPAISSQFGMLDTTGAFKDSAWYLKSQWSTVAMAHIVGHWNWADKEGQAITLWVHGTGNEAELIVNGRSQGRRAIPDKGHAEWQVPYAPGRVEAIVYRAGKAIARDRIETAGPARSLTQTVKYPAALSGKGRIAVIDVSALDAKGRLVPIAQDQAEFALSGSAKILGMGNGDPGSHDADSFLDQIAISRFSNWEMADLPVGQATYPDADALKWRDPFRRHPPGTEPATPQAFALRGQLVGGAPVAGALHKLHIPCLVEGQRIFVNGIEVTKDRTKDGDGWSVKFRDIDGQFDFLLLVPAQAAQALARVQDVSDNGNNVAYRQTVTLAPAWTRHLFNGHAQIILRCGNAPARSSCSCGRQTSRHQARFWIADNNK